MIGPSPRAPAGLHAPEIELCLKESETSGSQSIGGGDFSSSNSSLSLRHSPIQTSRREGGYSKTELELPTRLAFNLLSPSCLLALSRA